MIIYLLIGLILFSLLLQDLDNFFAHLDEGSKQLKEQFPKFSKKFIRMGMCAILVIFWILWPFTIPYIFIKERR